jgi:hypothetical protein
MYEINVIYNYIINVFHWSAELLWCADAVKGLNGKVKGTSQRDLSI